MNRRVLDLTGTGEQILPEPEEEALKHSHRLVDRIKNIIHDQGGIISFADYMQLALYEPGLGYYSGGAFKIGKSGDYITAPEFSSIFSKCIANQCAQVLEALDSPIIVEIGPGTGVMACDILNMLETLECLPDQYVLFETSADLRERQQTLLEQRIGKLGDRVKWCDTLPDDLNSCIVLANEVLDAMPVHRIKIDDDNIQEICVGWNDNRFIWLQRPATYDLEHYTREILENKLNNLSAGYITEINRYHKPWVISIAEKLKQGMMLFTDYGYPRSDYFHPQRSEGTLLCHYRHHVHQDPFFLTGLQDITASVDFTAIAEAAIDCGMDVSGYTTQAHFLMGCGLEKIMDQQVKDKIISRAETAGQVRRLTLPGEMGERFKAIALTKGLHIPLSGFRLFDHRYRL